MISNIFKGLFLAVSITACFFLYGIYESKDNGRFQIATQQDEWSKVIDTKTGQVYIFEPTKGYYLYNLKGVKVYYKIPPQ
ncbi:hypothetical protein [uncultured Mucilaginibacter sp.]|uniref:hypothetical protein n=1 Tax=uncultured Mucilaginibacter sp. TaxID=797541 RepID=UPI0025F357F3|nr:hypothetical protein [uncultured Mucilaginibacter sp.]